MKKILYMLLGFLLGVFILTKMGPKNMDAEPLLKGKTQSLSLSQDFESVPKNKTQIPIAAWVIIPENCRSCQTGTVVDQLKILFPGLAVQYLGSQEPQALEMIKLFQIRMLPAYIFSKEVEKSTSFEQLRSVTTFVQDKYYFDPAFTGVSYFWGRVLEPKRIDLFVYLTHPETLPILNMIEGLQGKEDQLKFSLHLVGDRDSQTNTIISSAGPAELAEDKLFACVDRHYPQKSWEYLKCRLGDADRLWLDECLGKNDIKKDQIKSCMEGDEGVQLLDAKIRLSQDLNISYAPLLLLDNVEIFGANERTTADEILSIIEPSKVIPSGGK